MALVALAKKGNFFHIYDFRVKPGTGEDFYHLDAAQRALLDSGLFITRELWREVQCTAVGNMGWPVVNFNEICPNLSILRCSSGRRQACTSPNPSRWLLRSAVVRPTPLGQRTDLNSRKLTLLRVDSRNTKLFRPVEGTSSAKGRVYGT